MGRISEQDEFLLSQLLDGDLAPEEAAAIRKRLEHEPSLRAAYGSLTRVNAALSVRRGEVPDIDWVRFHDRVMAGVREQAERRWIIRLPRWSWAAVPLAAAAAIALVVMVERPSGQRQTGPQFAERIPEPTVATPEVQLTVRPVPEKMRTLAVQYRRPSGHAPASVVQVAYLQSKKLASEMQERDKEYRGRPSSHLYVAQVVKKSRNELTEEIPPL